MKKRLLSLLLVFGMLSVCACGQQTDESVQPTEGSQADNASAEGEEQDFSDINEFEPDENGVYRIYTQKGLENMAAHPDGKFELLTDIDCGGADWKPVGNSAEPFSGKIEGKGFVISNINIITGEDGYTGFFGVNTGSAISLKLKGVTIKCESGYCGAIAGKNEGTIDMCSAEGVMEISKTAVAGGLVGTQSAGTLSYSEAGVRIEAASPATVGLLGGELKNITVEYCTYYGNMNTIDGKFIETFAGDEENVNYVSCLKRDNSNSTEFLSPEAQEIRSIAEQRMRRMGTIEWSVSQNLTFLYPTSTSHNQYFVVGETYKGVPYTGKCSSLERFLYCFNEDGTLKDFVLSKPVGYDNYDMYMGVDCSGAVYWAWAGISPSTNFHWTQNMLPSNKEGCLPVGDYEGAMTLADSKEVYDLNSIQKMAECYALTHKGDAITTYYNDKTIGAHENHTRLLAEDPVILRDSNGEIDVEASYLICHEQGAGLVMNHNSSWMIDRKISLGNLLRNYYLPLTNKELQEGKIPECEISVDNDKTGKQYMTTGTVETNYRLVSVTIEIKDSNEKTVWEKTLFTPVDKFDTARSDYTARMTARSFNLAAFAAYIGEMQLDEGETYTYTLSAVPATGDTYILKEFTFVQ